MHCANRFRTLSRDRWRRRLPPNRSRGRRRLRENHTRLARERKSARATSARGPQRSANRRLAFCASLFFFKQKTAYEIGLGIPAEPLFRSFFTFRHYVQKE